MKLRVKAKISIIPDKSLIWLFHLASLSWDSFLSFACIEKITFKSKTRAHYWCKITVCGIQRKIIEIKQHSIRNSDMKTQNNSCLDSNSSYFNWRRSRQTWIQHTINIQTVFAIVLSPVISGKLTMADWFRFDTTRVVRRFCTDWLAR